MKQLKLKITLESDALTASGEGFGDLIDNDSVYDETGLPYIPAKRIKGLLKDSAKEIKDIGIFSKLPGINDLFGKSGNESSAPVFISDLYIGDYDNIHEWMSYFITKGIISAEEVRSYYTNIRTQTKLNEGGTAEDNSLRTIRVVNKGMIYEGDINLEGNAETQDKSLKLLILACANLKMMGTKRNRGYGRIKAELYENNNNLFREFFKTKEDLCIS